MNTIGCVYNAVVANGARSATKYLSDRLVVRATRRLYGGKILPKHYNTEVVITVGRPNYRERQFIKECKRAGESFPVRKIQLRFPRRR